MKRLGELYKRFRFLLMVIPFLVLVLPFLATGWSPRFWNATILLTQCPFIAIGHSVRDDESMSGLFTIGFLLCFFIFIERFSNLTYDHKESSIASLGLLALMIVFEVFAIEILGWFLNRFSQRTN